MAASPAAAITSSATMAPRSFQANGQARTERYRMTDGRDFIETTVRAVGISGKDDEALQGRACGSNLSRSGGKRKGSEMSIFGQAVGERGVRRRSSSPVRAARRGDSDDSIQPLHSRT